MECNTVTRIMMLFAYGLVRIVPKYFIFYNIVIYMCFPIIAKI